MVVRVEALLAVTPRVELPLALTTFSALRLSIDSLLSNNTVYDLWPNLAKQNLC